MFSRDVQGIFWGFAAIFPWFSQVPLGLSHPLHRDNPRSMALKSLLILCQLGLVAALSPGAGKGNSGDPQKKVGQNGAGTSEAAKWPVKLEELEFEDGSSISNAGLWHSK